MTPDPIYTEKIGFMAKPVLKKALESFSEEEGIKPAVICRKAIFNYLKEKGKIKKNKKEYI